MRSGGMKRNTLTILIRRRIPGLATNTVARTRTSVQIPQTSVQVFRTNVQVPGTWYQLPGTRYLVPGTWYQVPGTGYLVPDTRYQVQGTSYPNKRSDAPNTEHRTVRTVRTVFIANHMFLLFLPSCNSRYKRKIVRSSSEWTLAASMLKKNMYFSRPRSGRETAHVLRGATPTHCTDSRVRVVKLQLHESTNTLSKP